MTYSQFVVPRDHKEKKLMMLHYWYEVVVKLDKKNNFFSKIIKWREMLHKKEK